ncbi:MAG: ankyrin repeat domain-containing protein [Candidatus Endonucleobacter sp. (ex Gigantidas childressi)]|nr:ankyrin repeat domain-containing protein [Candidatus Endonucleobacter sp. (ex Gigantidas childressi)]
MKKTIIFFVLLAMSSSAMAGIGDTLHKLWCIPSEGKENITELSDIGCSKRDREAVKLQKSLEHMNTKLLMSIEHNDRTLIEQLLKKGVSVNRIDDLGNTPLHLACKKDDNSIFDMLLEYGANVNAKNNRNQGVLHIAVGSHMLENTRALLNKGADVNQTNTDEETPIFLTILHNDMLSILLQNNANVNHTDKKGNTVLHYAVINGSISTVSILLESGAAINLKGYQGCTPIYNVAMELKCCRHGDAGKKAQELISYLVSNGADINIEDDFQSTPLYSIAPFADIEDIKILLDNGADIEVVHKWNDYTILHYIIECKQPDNLEFFLNSKLTDNKGESFFVDLIECANKRKNTQCIQILLDFLKTKDPSIGLELGNINDNFHQLMDNLTVNQKHYVKSLFLVNE